MYIVYICTRRCVEKITFDCFNSLKRDLIYLDDTGKGDQGGCCILSYLFFRLILGWNKEKAKYVIDGQTI